MDGVCQTEPKSVVGPLSLKVGGNTVTATTFQATWAPHWNVDRDSCVFRSWDVQAKAVNVEWPDIYTNVTEANASDPENDVRDTREYEGWAPLPYNTYDIYRTVTNWKKIYRTFWDNGTIVSTSNESYTLEEINRTEIETRSFNGVVDVTDKVYACSVANQGIHTCILHVDSGVRYDVRVRESCLENKGNSAWTYVNASLRPLTAAPEIVKVKPVLHSFLGFRESP
jgi:hypothetical protein